MEGQDRQPLHLCGGLRGQIGRDHPGQGLHPLAAAGFGAGFSRFAARLVFVCVGEDVGGVQRLLAHRGPGLLVVAQHGAVDLPQVGHRPLGQHGLAVEEGVLQPFQQSSPVPALVDAHAAAQVIGLDDRRIANLLLDAVGGGLRTGKIRAAPHLDAGDTGHPVHPEQGLGGPFVHADGAGRHIRPGIGQAQPLKVRLHDAVFAAGAVKDGQRHIQL